MGQSQMCRQLAVVHVQVSFGPISWLMVGEVFPLAVRGPAAALATLTNFGSNFLVRVMHNHLCYVKILMASHVNVLLVLQHEGPYFHCHCVYTSRPRVAWCMVPTVCAQPCLMRCRGFVYPLYSIALTSC